ncbi:WG repeat-containing protein [Paenibacillus sp. HJGM_3]|uniref:WG repeat-containing protein n=1 Tax=Paenibacillus sp. HJGM_3 TaxID=3379816 RepID=UPI0038580671
MLKKALALALTATLLCASPIYAEDAAPIQVFVNRHQLKMELPPFIREGTTFVPFRPIFEKLGLIINWEESYKSIEGHNANFDIKLQIGSLEAQVNNKPYTLDYAPVIIDGNTFIPLRFVVESLNGIIEWDDTTRTIAVSTTLEEKLLLSIAKQDLLQAKAYLKLGAYANYTNVANQSVLELAIAKLPALVPDLLQTGADPNSKSLSGDYPLHEAVQLNQVEVVTALLNAQALTSAKDSSNRTPLELAIEMQASPALTKLLEEAKNTQSTAAPKMLWPVQVNNKYGYIDRVGHMIVSPQYDAAEPFSDGMAVIGIHEQKTWLHGYIDLSGKVALEPTYRAAYPFSQGLAPVSIVNGSLSANTLFIDKTGTALTGIAYSLASPFHDGMAAVMTIHTHLDEYKIGFVDLTGKEVIPQQYAWDITQSQGFNEGLAAVTKDRKNWGYIDTTGKQVIPFQYLKARTFSHGLAPVKTSADPKSSWGFIDASGKLVLEAKYMDAREFTEGLAAVKMATPDGGAWGYIDTKGTMVIPPQFENADYFREGVAAASSLGAAKKNGYINTKGDWVIQPSFRYAYPFENGIASVSIMNGKETTSRYIDHTGRFIWEPPAEM